MAYNYIANFHDGVDHATYGNPDGTPNAIRDRLPVSIDFYNNDITNVDDNCIEADGAAHNVRIFRNRCFNHGHRALSAQPVFGGPVYYIRNLVYHAPEGGALKTSSTPAGLVVYHNTLHRAGALDVGGDLQPAFPEQPDSRAERSSRAVHGRHVHQLFDVGLQRLSPERGRRVLVPVEFAAVRDPRGLRREAARRETSRRWRRSATPPARTGTAFWWTTTCFRRSSAPDPIRSAQALQAGGLRFSSAARIEGGRCRDSSSERQRRFDRPGARSRSLRERSARPALWTAMTRDQSAS